MQITSCVLMIRPMRFAGNTQTASSNRFQQLADDAGANVQHAALHEFEHLVEVLRRAGVQVLVVDDTPEPHTPDSIFPNNWFSTHGDGTLVLYPMQALNRRLERRMDVFEGVLRSGLRITRTIDLTRYETDNEFLEGTGSLVLDRVNRIAYACLSPRTHVNVLHEFARQLEYQLVSFHATDAQGVPVYHTNVLMCVGARFAVLCAEAIAESQRAMVAAKLEHTGHEVIPITRTQMQQFAGNMLALRGHQERVALSASAHAALTAAQRTRLQTLGGELLVADIPTIERLGGGSVRCMLAEIFLPPQ